MTWTAVYAEIVKSLTNNKTRLRDCKMLNLQQEELYLYASGNRQKPISLVIYHCRRHI